MGPVGVYCQMYEGIVTCREKLIRRIVGLRGVRLPYVRIVNRERESFQ